MYIQFKMSRPETSKHLGLATETRNEPITGQLGVINDMYNSNGVQLGIQNRIVEGSGIQLGGKNAMYESKGVQLGALNSMGDESTGIQIGLLGNNSQNSNALQFSLGRNNSIDSNIVQVGLYNNKHNSDGLQVGLVNRDVELPLDQGPLSIFSHDKQVSSGLIPNLQVGLLNISKVKGGTVYSPLFGGSAPAF